MRTWKDWGRPVSDCAMWPLKASALRVFVDDLAAARHFYGTVLGLPVKWEWEETAVGFDFGIDLIVELVGRDAEPEDQGLVGRFTGASIEVENIAAAHAQLTARGVTFIGSPERQPWGGVLAHFRDPSRNVLTLVQTG
jgi:catechol 2,3-dioxygenase-like lactoylglutathione lyase family enzyme